jgi:hypothetical protein
MGMSCIVTAVAGVWFLITVAMLMSGPFSRIPRPETQLLSLAGSLVALIIGVRTFTKAPTFARAERLLIDTAQDIRGDESLVRYDYELAHLHRMLIEARPVLAVAILKILGAAGNRKSLRVVTDVRDLGYTIATGRYEAVQQAAVAAAEQIERRFDIARRKETLLRPASPCEEVLLRATVSQSETPDLLLRAGDPDENPTR